MLYFFLHREGGVNPINLKSAAFHTPEPGHLPLGELMDGNLKTREHLAIGQLPRQILSHKLIFQSVLDQVFCRYALIEQGLHLIHHPFVQPCLQTAGDLLPPQLTVDIYADDQRIHWR